MQRNVPAFSSTLISVRTLLAAGFAVALASLPACSTVASIADAHLTRQMTPTRLSRSYETPIPHNGRAQATSRVDTKGYEKMSSIVGTIFEVGGLFTPPGAAPQTGSSLRAARWVCEHNLSVPFGSRVWEKITRESGSLSVAVSQAMCVEKYRRVR